MRRVLVAMVLVVSSLALGAWLYLFRPFLRYPPPANLRCLDPSAGRFEALGDAGRVFGLGLSYAGHIAESPGLYDPGAPPPVFRKRDRTVNRSDTVPYPDRDALLEAVARLDALHARQLGEDLQEIVPLLDYEVEIGLVVRAPIDVDSLRAPDFAPPVGFFVANDLTARILIGMAPRFAQSVDYLAEGKGLAGFLPVGERQWVPDRPRADSWVCVDLVTEVNGETRQRSPSSDIIVGPREILLAVAERFDLSTFAPGDWVVTGTPPGVALQTPGWVQRAAALLDLDAATKVRTMAGATEDGGFLQPGDEVVVRAGFLGEKAVRIAPPPGAGRRTGDS